MPINITTLDAPAVGSLPMEIVERKGLGHPDTICDALAEQLSITLSHYYLEHFDQIFHHNVDKGLLWGGSTRTRFGGGEMLRPIELFLTGRATESISGVKIPLEELAIESTRSWIREHIRFLDAEQHVRIHCLIRPGSAELTELYLRQTGTPLANDTSCGVGYAPLDDLETIVLEVERHLNSAGTKLSHPALGEDIKVMGVRNGSRIHLTIACAMVAQHVADLPAYLASKAKVAELALTKARAVSGTEVDVVVNAADGTTEDSIYLTLTGTSAEAGDDGAVGRGNRVNGLISFYRPMSMEAIAGKNPVNHVGKLYNILANRIAQAAVSRLEGVEEAYCYLLGQIGRPIDDPQAVELQVRLAPGLSIDEIRAPLADIVEEHLDGVTSLWRELITGSLTLF